MFWFKNAMVYRLTSKIDFSKIEEALQTAKFTPCEKSDYSRFGWSEPLHDTGLLAYQASGHILLVSCKEEKILPAYAVNRKLAERLAELEEKEQRKLKKAEKLALKDDVRDDREFCYLGHYCDYRTWKSLREWINEQA